MRPGAPARRRRPSPGSRSACEAGRRRPTPLDVPGRSGCRTGTIRVDRGRGGQDRRSSARAAARARSARPGRRRRTAPPSISPSCSTTSATRSSSLTRSTASSPVSRCAVTPRPTVGEGQRRAAGRRRVGIRRRPHDEADVDNDTTGLAVQALVRAAPVDDDPAVTPRWRASRWSSQADGGWSTSSGPSRTRAPRRSWSSGIAAAGYDATTSCWRDTVAPELTRRGLRRPDGLDPLAAAAGRPHRQPVRRSRCEHAHHVAVGACAHATLVAGRPQRAADLRRLDTHAAVDRHSADAHVAADPSSPAGVGTPAVAVTGVAPRFTG